MEIIIYFLHPCFPWTYFLTLCFTHIHIHFHIHFVPTFAFAATHSFNFIQQCIVALMLLCDGSIDFQHCHILSYCYFLRRIYFGFVVALCLMNRIIDFADQIGFVCQFRCTLLYFQYSIQLFVLFLFLLCQTVCLLFDAVYPFLDLL